MKKIFYILLVLSLSIQTYAQNFKNIGGSLDSLIQQLPTKGPGGVLIISQNGQKLYHREFGYSNLEHQTLITNETVFEAASVSKQFAAAAILLLVEKGDISLNDDVRKYVPELPNYGKIINIKHLLTHTSGLKDWRNVTYLTSLATGARLYTQNDAIEMIIKQSNLNHDPGERYSYTNAGYDLLGIIVERITKKTFRDFTAEYLLKPAGMSLSNFRHKYTDVIPNFSTSYNGTPGNYTTAFILDETYGAAGLHTTADDLRKWNQFINGKAGENIKKLRLERYVLNNGKQLTYTNGGVNVNTIEGVQEIVHSGLLGGFRSLCVYYPESNISFTYMSNTRNIISGDIHAAVFEILFNKKYNKPLPTPNDINFDNGELDLFKGQFYNVEDFSEYLTFSVNNNTLINYQAKLSPVSRNSFLFEKNLYSFSITGDTLYMNRSGALSVFKRATDFKPTEKELAAFTGEFYSKDVEGKFEFTTKNGALIANKKGYNPIILTSAYKIGNEFYFRAFVNGLRIVFTFKKPAKGQIKELMVHLPRANNIPYSRTK